MHDWKQRKMKIKIFLIAALGCKKCWFCKHSSNFEKTESRILIPDTS